MRHVERRGERASGRLGRAFTRVGDVAKKTLIVGLKAGAAAATGMGVALGAATKAAADFEEAIVEVEKVTDPETANAMRESIMRMAEDIPLAQNELAELTAAAGRFGIRGPENLEKFVRATAKMATATDLDAGQAGEAFARLATLTGTPIPKIENLGSAVNELSNNMATSSSEIVDAMLRSAGAANRFGLSGGEIAAVSAAMNAVSESAERAGTRLRRLFQEVMDPAKTEDLAEALGMNVDQFERMEEQSPLELLREMARQFGSDEEAADALSTTLSTVSQQALAGLSQNIDGLNDALGIQAEQIRENTSIQREFDAATDTLNAQVQLLQNRLRNLAIEIGSEVIPVLRDVIDTVIENWPQIRETVFNVLSDVRQMAGQLINWFQQNWPVIQRTIVSTFNTIADRWNNVFRPVLFGFINMLRDLGRVADEEIPIFREIMVAAIGAVALAWKTSWRTTFAGIVFAGLIELVNWTGENMPRWRDVMISVITAVITAWKVRFRSTFPGLILGTLAGIIAWVSQNWSDVKDKILGPFRAILDWVETNFGRIVDTVKDVWRGIRQSIPDWLVPGLNEAEEQVEQTKEKIEDEFGGLPGTTDKSMKEVKEILDQRTREQTEVVGRRLTEQQQTWETHADDVEQTSDDLVRKWGDGQVRMAEDTESSVQATTQQMALWIEQLDRNQSAFGLFERAYGMELEHLQDSNSVALGRIIDFWEKFRQTSRDIFGIDIPAALEETIGTAETFARRAAPAFESAISNLVSAGGQFNAATLQPLREFIGELIDTLQIQLLSRGLASAASAIASAFITGGGSLASLPTTLLATFGGATGLEIAQRSLGLATGGAGAGRLQSQLRSVAGQAGGGAGGTGEITRGGRNQGAIESRLEQLLERESDLEDRRRELRQLRGDVRAGMNIQDEIEGARQRLQSIQARRRIGQISEEEARRQERIIRRRMEFFEGALQLDPEIRSIEQRLQRTREELQAAREARRRGEAPVTAREQIRQQLEQTRTQLEQARARANLGTTEADRIRDQLEQTRDRLRDVEAREELQPSAADDVARRLENARAELRRERARIELGAVELTERQQLRQQIDDLRGELERVEARESLQTSAAEDVERRLENARTELEKERARVTLGVFPEEESRVAHLENRVEELRAQLVLTPEGERRSTEIENRIKELENQLALTPEEETRVDRLQERVRTLQAQLELTPGGSEEAAQLRDRVQELEAQLELADEGPQDVERLRQRVEELRAELTLTPEEQTRSERLERQVERLEGDLEQARGEARLTPEIANDAFRKPLEQNSSELTQTRREITALTAELRDIRQEAESEGGGRGGGPSIPGLPSGGIGEMLGLEGNETIQSLVDLGESIGNLVKTVFTPFISVIKDLAEALSPVLDLLSPFIDLISSILDFVSSIIGPVLQFVADVLGFILDVVGAVISVPIAGLQSLLEVLGAAEPGTARSTLQGAFSGIGLQEGGLVTEPTRATMGERFRPEAVIPLDDARAVKRISGAMVRGMRDSPQTASGSRPSTADIRVFLDSQAILEALGEPMVDEIRLRTGASI